MGYVLSFCIPTYNFGAFIGETLESIVAQADERVQIVIVDGGSTDNTAEVVADYASRFPHIKFLQRTTNCGVDRDILESVELADGEYCWLLSSDDIVAPGAIARVLTLAADADWDVLLVGMTICGKSLTPMWRHPILRPAVDGRFDWGDSIQRLDYFRRAQTSTAFFSFISDIVVKRSSWRRMPVEECFIGSCWIIAAKLFALGRDGMNVRFDPRIAVVKRGENDSFSSRGLVGRTELSLKGFRELGEYFFGKDSEEARAVVRVLRNEYSLSTLLMFLGIVLTKKDADQTERFRRLLTFHYDRGTLGDRWARWLSKTSSVWLCRILGTGPCILEFWGRRIAYAVRGLAGPRD